MRNYDLEFLKRFSLLIFFLFMIMLSLILGALYINAGLPHDKDPAMTRITVERIAPVGAVYAGATGASLQAAAAASAAAAAASQVAYGGTKDGSVIYGNLCSGCHGAGAGGAPTLDHAHWDARIAQGKDTLHQHAIKGYQGAAGVMPAKGGNPALTDEQVIATVDWMVSNLK